MKRFYQMVEASNRRFPDGVEPFQMATRLLEECGEIASEINLWENSGIKRQKHGDPKKENIANEIRQAMVELVKIACYYHVESELEQSIEKSIRNKTSAYNTVFKTTPHIDYLIHSRVLPIYCKVNSANNMSNENTTLYF